MLVVILICYARVLFNCNFDIAEEESTIYIFVVPCTYCTCTLYLLLLFIGFTAKNSCNEERE